jgi:hypothetical protein
MVRYIVLWYIMALDDTYGQVYRFVVYHGFR